LVGLAYIILLGTIAGSGLWTMLMGRYPAGMVAPLSLLVPVVGIGASWLFLHEDPSPLSLVGAVIVIAGASAAQMRRKPAGTVFSDTPAASPPARLGV
jgi:O-acetylserine/cysteine efflux transporter